VLGGFRRRNGFPNLPGDFPGAVLWASQNVHPLVVPEQGLAAGPRRNLPGICEAAVSTEFPRPRSLLSHACERLRVTQDASAVLLLVSLRFLLRLERHERRQAAIVLAHRDTLRFARDRLFAARAVL